MRVSGSEFGVYIRFRVEFKARGILIHYLKRFLALRAGFEWIVWRVLECFSFPKLFGFRRSHSYQAGKAPLSSLGLGLRVI